MHCFTGILFLGSAEMSKCLKLTESCESEVNLSKEMMTGETRAWRFKRMTNTCIQITHLVLKTILSEPISNRGLYLEF